MIAAKENGEGETPFRIEFKGIVAQSFDELKANVLANDIYPHIDKKPLHDRPLAIVGGGPSLLDHVDTLKNWPGDIWAINRTASWLSSQGISSTLVSVDAATDPSIWPDPSSVKDSLFSSWCHPDVIARYPSPRVFHMQPVVDGGIHGGSTTAVSMPVVAGLQGYQDVTYFGCESSFTDTDHAYLDENRAHQLIVKVGGHHYRTTPPFFVQAQELAAILREFPQVYKEQSGGLLRAMIANTDWSIAAVSSALKDHLEDVNGKAGLYESAYEWNPNGRNLS